MKRGSLADAELLALSIEGSIGTLELEQLKKLTHPGFVDYCARHPNSPTAGLTCEIELEPAYAMTRRKLIVVLDADARKLHFALSALHYDPNRVHCVTCHQTLPIEWVGREKIEYLGSIPIASTVQFRKSPTKALKH